MSANKISRRPMLPDSAPYTANCGFCRATDSDRLLVVHSSYLRGPPKDRRRFGDKADPIPAIPGYPGPKDSAAPGEPVVPGAPNRASVFLSSALKPCFPTSLTHPAPTLCGTLSMTITLSTR